MRGNMFDPVPNGKNKTNLSNFDIIGLFNQYDVSLLFDKEVNIYIGENGLGKTTILNCLYYVLSKNFIQLASIDFKKIVVGFISDPNRYAITKADVMAFNQKENHGLYSQLKTELYLAELNLYPEELKGFDEYEMDYLIRKFAIDQGISTSAARKQIHSYMSVFGSSRKTKGEAKNVRRLSEAIDKNLRENVVYLPTYRRIENDFNNLRPGTRTPNGTEFLIQFGMADVSKSIDSILHRINVLAVQGYNELTGFLLEQYAREGEIKIRHPVEINIQIVKIVLDRLGGKIKESAKSSIIQSIESGEIYDGNHDYLLNLLQKLISSYDAQKQLDDRINSFVRTCNKYLNDKQFRYNPSDLKLDIVLDSDSNSEIKLPQLSSGEKQIVSLFAKLYLEFDDTPTNKKNILIIDEPELSLSINWQQMLIPDIMRSESCKLLLTVTHSPFIFENEFDMDAKEIRAHMYPSW